MTTGEYQKVWTEEEGQKAQRYYSASQFQLMWWKFKKNRIAVVGAIVYLVFMIVALFAEFVAPTTQHFRDREYTLGPPQIIRFVDEEGVFHLRPFVYGTKTELDKDTFKMKVTIDTSERLPVGFFVHGESYQLWGLFESDIHLFGIQGQSIHFLGTDKLGRDLLSRIIYATRVSLSIGIFGILTSFTIGLLLGGVAGFLGGKIDKIIQRSIEFILSLPLYPIWMAIAAAVPKEWEPIKIYILITIMIGLFSWTGLARRIRGLVRTMRNEDYVISAKVSGCSDLYIIVRHMLPSCLSYIIVDFTVTFPKMILGETALSFLGLGLQPPVVSWGVMLSQVAQLEAIILQPWMLSPAVALIISMLAVNLIGDGMRDAADPYSK